MEITQQYLELSLLVDVASHGSQMPFVSTIFFFFGVDLYLAPQELNYGILTGRSMVKT